MHHSMIGEGSRWVPVRGKQFQIGWASEICSGFKKNLRVLPMPLGFVQNYLALVGWRLEGGKNFLHSDET